MARWWAALVCATLLISAAAASDITIKDVTVTLLEGSGTEVSTKALSGPSSESLGVLDHTRALRVGAPCALLLPCVPCSFSLPCESQVALP